MRKQQRNEAEITVARKLHQGSPPKTGSNCFRAPARLNIVRAGLFWLLFFRKKSDKKKQINKTCPLWRIRWLVPTGGSADLLRECNLYITRNLSRSSKQIIRVGKSILIFSNYHFTPSVARSQQNGTPPCRISHTTTGNDLCG